MTHPYTSRTYAEAIADGAPVVPVGELDTWAILRPIPGTGLRDARTPYPFSPLARPRSGRALQDALAISGIVSLVATTDALDEDRGWYPDIFDFARPYKTHFVIDRDRTPVHFSKHHRHEVRKAERVCEAATVGLGAHLDEWCALYDDLIARHRLGDAHRFSRSYFEALAHMPEFVAVAAMFEGRMVSCHIWLKLADRAYSHLSASSEKGYRHGGAYAVLAHAIGTFDDCRLIDLGGVPDTADSAGGLARFKKGFANGTRTNWICGSIVDRDQYALLSGDAGRHSVDGEYFPAYRSPRLA